MHRARRQNMPELPKEIKDIQLEGEWATTLSGKEFVIRKDDKIIILTSNSTLSNPILPSWMGPSEASHRFSVNSTPPVTATMAT